MLKPCPFCGGVCDPEGWVRDDGVRGPECEECGATAVDADAWNFRGGSMTDSKYDVVDPEDESRHLSGPRLSDMIERDGTIYTTIWSVLLPNDRREPLGGVRCYSMRSEAVAEARRLWPDLPDDED